MHTPGACETRTVVAPATQEQWEGGSEHRLAATFRRRARRGVWERDSGAELRYPVERDRELRRLPLPINRECIGVAAATASQMK